MLIVPFMSLALLSIAFFSWDNDFFTLKWSLAFGLLALAYLYYLSTKFKSDILPLAALFMGHILWISVFPYNEYAYGNAYDLLAYEKLAMLSLTTFIFVTLTLSLPDARDLVYFKPVFILIAIVNSAVIICQKYAGGALTGTLGNPSMTASLISCILPLARKRYWPLFIAAILACNSSVGYLTLAVSLGFALYLDKKINRRMLLITGALLAIPPFFMKDFTSSSGRTDIWRLGFRYWQDHINLFFGSGAGLTRVFLPYAQVKYDFIPHPKEIWIWFHNDFFQILFEQGVIGAIFTLAILGGCMRELDRRENWYLVPTFFSAILMTLFNYPLQLPVHSLFIAWVLALLFRRQDLKSGE